MTEFEVTITETLEKTVFVKAMTSMEAEQIVACGWKNSKYILGADDFIGVEVKASIEI